MGVDGCPPNLLLEETCWLLDRLALTCGKRKEAPHGMRPPCSEVHHVVDISRMVAFFSVGLSWHSFSIAALERQREEATWSWEQQLTSGFNWGQPFLLPCHWLFWLGIPTRSFYTKVLSVTYNSWQVAPAQWAASYQPRMSWC